MSKTQDEQNRIEAEAAKVDLSEHSRKLGIRLIRGQWLPAELPLPNPNRRWATKAERVAADTAALDAAFTPKPASRKKEPTK